MAVQLERPRKADARPGCDKLSSCGRFAVEDSVVLKRVGQGLREAQLRIKARSASKMAGSGLASPVLEGGRGNGPGQAGRCPAILRCRYGYDFSAAGDEARRGDAK